MPTPNATHSAASNVLAARPPPGQEVDGRGDRER